ncbi:hypothetical protein Hdeb2414_s0005g00175981 [Helianthus debilis subsp. tardiflorus]
MVQHGKKSLFFMPPFGRSGRPETIAFLSSISYSVLKVVDGIKEDSFMWLKHRAPFSDLV